MISLAQKLLLNREPIGYRDWKISTQVIEGKLWLRWQHPLEDFPRYSYPVGHRGLAEAVHQVRFFIDLAIKLEQGRGSKN
jgi:hypothetical protein